MKGMLVSVVLAALLAAGAVWYYHPDRRGAAAGERAADEPEDTEWLEHIYSPDTRDAAEAVRHVEMLGEKAVPIIQSTLQDPRADREHRRAALKACTVLGDVAAPAIPDVAAQLPLPDITIEAALALSYMGREAFAPLREALDSDDPIVRREALRSIGKLKDRAPLDSRAVLPLLLAGIQDPDPGVRAVAATYIGIIHEDAARSVPVLVTALADPKEDVRRAAAEALGAFPEAADAALPALRKAAGDRDPEVAREAGLAIVKLQSAK